VEVRLSPDLQALERDELRIIYFNCRVTPITDEIAALTVEIAHWVLAQNQIQIGADQIEVIDLATGKVHKRKTLRPSTVKAIKNNGRIIEALWSTV
jgi:phage host-nuclease inhibitor protein Gam